MINLIKERFVVRSYVRVLPIVLKKIYGKHKHYSEIEVRDAISSANLNDNYIDYAFAIFLSKKNFKIIRSKDNSLRKCNDLRKILAKRFFKGDMKFSIHDILKNAHSQINRKTNITFDGNVSGSEFGD